MSAGMSLWIYCPMPPTRHVTLAFLDKVELSSILCAHAGPMYGATHGPTASDEQKPL